MEAGIDLLVQVKLHIASNRLKAKQFRVLCFCQGQRLYHHRSKRSPQPFVRRDIEADLLAAHDRRGQLEIHQFLEQILLACPTNLEIGGEGRGKFHDAMVQEGRTDFDRVRHAHAVGFHQDVIGKIVFLVKLKKRCNPIPRESFSKASKNARQACRQRGADNRPFLGL